MQSPGFIHHLSISRKLWLTLLTVVALLAGGAGFIQFRMASSMQASLLEMRRYESRIHDALRWKGLSEATLPKVLVVTTGADPVLEQDFAEGVRTGIAAISEIQKKIVDGAVTDEEKSALQTVAARREVLLRHTRVAGEMRKSGSTAAELQAYVRNELMPSVAPYLGALGDFIELQRRQRDAALAAANEESSRLQRLGALGLAAVAALGLAMASLVVRSISVPLKQAVGISQAVAGGDLGVRAGTTRRDELGDLMRAMDAMAARLSEVVSDVRRGVESVGTASAQIATGSADLSARTEAQAANVQQTAASMEELTATVRQNADNARAASQIADSACAVAEKGQDVVGQVIETMNHIDDSAKRVADIVGVIDSIAFQTNILALNASVEAARAGEQGRGFAVVAGEVRSLAQRSAQAAREIKRLIQQSGERVGEGSTLVGQAGQTMQEVLVQVRKVTDLVGEISAASAEQARGIEQVGSAVSQLDRATQQNAALVEESAAAAASMRQQAHSLSEAVSVFRLGEPAA